MWCIYRGKSTLWYYLVNNLSGILMKAYRLFLYSKLHTDFWLGYTILVMENILLDTKCIRYSTCVDFLFFLRVTTLRELHPFMGKMRQLYGHSDDLWGWLLALIYLLCEEQWLRSYFIFIPSWHRETFLFWLWILCQESRLEVSGGSWKPLKKGNKFLESRLYLRSEVWTAGGGKSDYWRANGQTRGRRENLASVFLFYCAHAHVPLKYFEPNLFNVGIHIQNRNCSSFCK